MEAMNDMLGSECSNGCESGWTLYLEHSFLSHRNNEFGDGKGIYYNEEKRVTKVEDEEEEEDLSMVSDASSGPPLFHDEEYFGNANNGCFYNAPIEATLPNNNHKKRKNSENRRQKIEEDPLLDDTASSPIFNFTQSNFTLTNNHQASVENNLLDFSQGCSTTHYEGRSAFHEPSFGFFQSSLSGNQLQQNQWLGGKMGMR